MKTLVQIPCVILWCMCFGLATVTFSFSKRVTFRMTGMFDDFQISFDV